MKTLRICVCLFLALSCAEFISAQTLHPLYKGRAEEVFEPAMLGAWVSCVGSAFTICVEFHFEKSPNVGYRVISPFLDDPKIQGVFAFHLIRLGDTLFGDMTLTDIIAEGHSINIDLDGQFHRIYRVSLKENKFTTAEVAFRFEETQKAAAEDGIQLRLEPLEDGSLVSLASTKDLQEFVKKAAKDKRVFSGEVEWDRPEKADK